MESVAEVVWLPGGLGTVRARKNDLLTRLIAVSLWCSAALEARRGGGHGTGPAGIRPRWHRTAWQAFGRSPHTELQVLLGQKSCQLRLVGPDGLLLSYSSTGCTLPSLGVVFYRLPALAGTSDLADTRQFSLALYP